MLCSTILFFCPRTKQNMIKRFLSSWTKLPDSSHAKYMLRPGHGAVYHRHLPKSDTSLYIGAATDTSLDKVNVGNGGMRLWKYHSAFEASQEALALAQGMDSKHAVYHTGFGGSKIVVDCNNPSGSARALMLDEVADVLNEFEGIKYTGGDLNTTDQDMAYLYRRTPYVLSGLSNPAIDPNLATAYGVVGSILGLGRNVKQTSLFVHGCGKVGHSVARILLEEHGAAKVYVYDQVKDRMASVHGSIPVTGVIPEHDVFVPCSASGILDEAFVRALPAQYIVGATNLPFLNEASEALFGGSFVPECISSAGAIIVDSVEHFSPDKFELASPAPMYRFVEEATKEKTQEFMALQKFKVPGVEAVKRLSRSAAISGVVLGKRFFSTAPRQHAMSGMKPTLNACDAEENKYVNNAAKKAVYDVVIAGAGIMGLATAFQLKKADPTVTVLVCEKTPSLGNGSSGWSTGFLRAFYSFDETMQLAIDGMDAYHRWGEFLGLSDVEASFSRTGALWMLGKSKCEYEAIQNRLAKFRMASHVMDKQDVQDTFPALCTDPYVQYDPDTGEPIDTCDNGPFYALHEIGCGYMDPSACLQDLFRACEEIGVTVRFNTGVRQLDVAGDCLSGIVTTEGETIAAHSVVNCMGPWFDRLNRTASVTTTTTMLPTRIQVGHKSLPDDEDLLSLPFVADSDVYFMPRRNNKQLVFGSVAHRFESEIVVRPDELNTALDPDVKADYLGCLSHRLPTLAMSGSIQGFSHMYTVNQDDVHPVVGPSAKYANYFLCNGFSGHGFKLAPAIGSLLSQQILRMRCGHVPFQTNVPTSFLSPSRKPLTLGVKTHFA